MINKDKTLTVGDLLKMLANGRVTVDMPIAVFHNTDDFEASCGVSNYMVGIVAVEIITFDDDSKGLTIYTGEPCADLSKACSAAEVFI